MTGLCALAMLAAPAARAKALEAPVGYLGFEQRFAEGAGGEDGFGAVVFGMELRSPLEDAAGTFWANQFDFAHSAGGLPANFSQVDQGGYLGLQAHKGEMPTAIFSIWWASEAEAGPGATCISDIEAWYDDDRPFEPDIETVEGTDPNRQVDGGPFRSCRLKVALETNVAYGLRLQSEGDGWWSAWLDASPEAGGGREAVLIGRLRVPADWGGVSADGVNGFMERFTDLPKGCASIAPSVTVFAPAIADDGAARAEVGAGLYGVCKPALEKRTVIAPVAGGGVSVTIR